MSKSIGSMEMLIHEDRVVRNAPRRRPGDEPASFAPALAADLAGRIEGDVCFDAGSRALYATDASNYRQVPIGIVVPKSLDDVEAAVATCRQYGAPVLARG